MAGLHARPDWTVPAHYQLSAQSWRAARWRRVGEMLAEQHIIQLQQRRMYAELAFEHVQGTVNDVGVNCLQDPHFWFGYRHSPSP